MKLSAQKEESLTKAGLAASVVAALAASICCIGPIAAAFLGLTSFGAFVRYEAYRPFLAVITLGLLGSAFYLAYRRQETSCESGSLCARRGVNRSVLWVVTVFVLVILTFPTWSNWVLGMKGLTMKRALLISAVLVIAFLPPRALRKRRRQSGTSTG